MPHAVNVTPAEQEAIGRVYLYLYIFLFFLRMICALFISIDLPYDFAKK